jgi:hypothetical protein
VVSLVLVKKAINLLRNANKQFTIHLRSTSRPDKKEIQMKYTVHQINLSDDQFNAHRDTYLNTTFHPTNESILAARGLYAPVAEINALSLNQVFDIGNIGPESKITRLAPMHSISVGDVIVDEDGHAVYVAPFGFNSLDVIAEHFATGNITLNAA